MTVEPIPQAEPHTVEDVLEQFPEDKRIELLEATLIVPVISWSPTRSPACSTASSRRS